MCKPQPPGLPVLLTRYALVQSGTTAPKVTAPFKAPDIGLGKHAAYTQRLLRNGFLYAFDEKKQELWGYYVTDKSYLVPFNINNPPSVDELNKKVPCKPAKNSAVAGCINIPDAANKTIYWFAFSDAEWTKDVWLKHCGWVKGKDNKWTQEADKGLAYRKKHMMEFNVQKWLAGSHPGADSITKLASCVAEYRPGKPEQAKSKDDPRLIKKYEAFESSLDPFAYRPDYFPFGGDLTGEFHGVEPLSEDQLPTRDNHWHGGYGISVSSSNLNHNGGIYYKGNQSIPQPQVRQPGTSLIQGESDLRAKLQENARAYQGFHERLRPMIKTPEQVLDHGWYLDLARISAAQHAITTLQKLHKKAVIFAIKDPVGITQDLAALINAKLRIFTDNVQKNDKLDTRKIAVASAIEGLQEMIREQAKADVVQNAQDRQSRAINQSEFGVPLGQEMTQFYDDMGQFTQEELADAYAKGWDKYLYYPAAAPNKPSGIDAMTEASSNPRTKRYDDTKTATILSDYRAELEKYDADVTLPLAEAHKKWMKSTWMFSYLEHNFDTNNIKSGEAYTRTVVRCLGDTQNLKPCFNLYADWFKAEDIKDKSNILLRALILNQDYHATIIATSHTESLKANDGLTWVGIWQNLLNAINYSVDALNAPATASSPFAMLMLKISGVIAKYAKSETMVKVAGRVAMGLLAVGAFNKIAIIPVNLCGNKKLVLKTLVTTLVERAGPEAGFLSRGAIQQHAMNRVEALIMEAGATKYFANGSFNFNGFLYIEKAALPGVLQKAVEIKKAGHAYNSKAADSVAKLLADTVQFGHADEVGAAIFKERWEILVDNSRLKTIKHFPSGALVVIGFLSLGSLTSAYDAVFDAAKMSNNKALFEAVSKLGGSVMGAASAFGQVIERAIEHIPALNQKYGLLASDVSIINRYTFWVKKFMVKWLGIGAACVTGLWDVEHGMEARQKGQFGLMNLYFISAATGPTSAILLLMYSRNPYALTIGIFLLLIYIVANKMIDTSKENPLQEWLPRCVLGNGNNKFPSIDAELQALQVATGYTPAKD
jgi:hypothetical protein